MAVPSLQPKPLGWQCAESPAASLSPNTGVIDLAAQREALVLGKLWMPLQPRALPAPEMSEQRAVGLPPVLPVVPRACSARWLQVKFLVKLSW